MYHWIPFAVFYSKNSRNYRGRIRWNRNISLVIDRRIVRIYYYLFCFGVAVAIVRDGDCRFFRVFLICGDIYRYYYGILFFTINFRVFGFVSVSVSVNDIADDEDDDTDDTTAFTSSWSSCVVIVSSSIGSI